MQCGATQDGWVMVERSDKMWSTGEGNGKPFQYYCLENPMDNTERQNDRILKEELPRMKGWSQSKNNTQLWMGLVIEAMSNAVNSNIA